MKDPSAQYNLGYRYFTGTDVPEDYGKAVYWFKKAAEQGHANAQYYLGQCYEKGFGVYKDEETALKWYNLAAVIGELEIAEFSMGSLLVRMEETKIAREKSLNEKTKKKKKTRSLTKKDYKDFILSMCLFAISTVVSVIGFYMGKKLRDGDFIQFFVFLGLCATYGFCIFTGGVNLLEYIGPFFGLLVPIGCAVLFIINYLQIVPVAVTSILFLFSLLGFLYVKKKLYGEWKMSKHQLKNEKKKEKELIQEYRKSHPTSY